MSNRNRTMRKKRKAKGSHVPVRLSPVMRSHLRSLGIKTVDEYKRWCKDNHFKACLKKTWNELHNEIWLLKRQKAEEADRQKRNNLSPKKKMARYLNGKTEASESVPYQIQMVFQDRKKHKARKKYREILPGFLKVINKRSDLLELERTDDYSQPYIDGILELAKKFSYWIRPIESWRPKTYNKRVHFHSLARHLLAEYEVPFFLDECWFEENKDQQRWYVHVAQGGNIRKCFLPITLSKKQAHHFLKAPAKYTIDQALRWGRIRAMGGEAKLVDAVINSRLINSWDHYEFWDTLIRFFIQHPSLDRSHFSRVADYVYYQKFENQFVSQEDGGYERRPPLQPNFSMAHRTPKTLMSQVDGWFETIGLVQAYGKITWDPTPKISPLNFTDSDEAQPQRWQINELLTNGSLEAEGKAMDHCVGTYVNDCYTKHSSIWSMRCNGERRVTIEVNSNRHICQASGYSNVDLSKGEMKILKRWAKQNRLSVGKCL